MDVPCMFTICFYWVISAIGNFSFWDTDKKTKDDNRFAGLPQALNLFIYLFIYLMACSF